MKSEISQEQQEKIKLMASTFANMDHYEQNCYHTILFEEVMKRKGRHPIIDGLHLAKPFKLANGDYPHILNSFLQNEAMAAIWTKNFENFSMGTGQSSGSSGKGDEAVAEVVQEIQEEVFFCL